MALTKVQRIMTQPINLIFRFLQSKARIQIWLFEQKDLRIEGRIIVIPLTAQTKINKRRREGLPIDRLEVTPQRWSLGCWFASVLHLLEWPEWQQNGLITR
ncbi:small nuclear ribonucleoprotein E-like isoform X3 [Phragmites australis]|nr:small nuclear ribonucleoprotein E-like isoform X3 [Phragmites australis]